MSMNMKKGAGMGMGMGSKSTSQMMSENMMGNKMSMMISSINSQITMFDSMSSKAKMMGMKSHSIIMHQMAIDERKHLMIIKRMIGSMLGYYFKMTDSDTDIDYPGDNMRHRNTSAAVAAAARYASSKIPHMFKHHMIVMMFNDEKMTGDPVVQGVIFSGSWKPNMDMSGDMQAVDMTTMDMGNE